MIEIKSVHKKFGKNRVLKGINLSVEKGKVIGLLGPNGSGKSTLIKSILNLVKINKGEILVNQIPVQNVKARSFISYMPQVAHFAENISAKKLIQLICELRNEFPDSNPLIQYFGLTLEINKPLGNLSGGTRQKVSAVLAFLYNSPIIILDEPTVGLDPISRVKFKELVLEEKQKGKTIFFTSHIMSDVEELSDELAFLLDGNIVFKGKPKELINSTQQNNLEKAMASYLQNNSI